MSYVNAETVLGKLPPYRDEWILINESQDVGDIVKEVIDAHKQFEPYYDKISSFFTGGSIGEISERLYNFCVQNISYHEESEDDQTTAAPQGVLTRGYGDCKQYAGFIGGVLGAMQRAGKKLDWAYRFASYRLFDKTPHHVFIVVNDTDGETELWIDPTPKAKDLQPYWYQDRKPGTVKNSSMLSRNISGVGYAEAPTKIYTGLLQEPQTFTLPPGSDLVWIAGQWYVQPPHEFPAIGQADLVSTGISIISDITKLFGSHGPTAAYKIFSMFPLSQGSGPEAIRTVLNAAVAHENNDAGLDSSWIAAFMDLKRQYTNALNLTLEGAPMPPIAIPAQGQPSYYSLPPGTPVAHTKTVPMPTFNQIPPLNSFPAPTPSPVPVVTDQYGNAPTTYGASGGGLLGSLSPLMIAAVLIGGYLLLKPKTRRA